MVFAFVEGAKTFTEGMDKSDEVKLLRLRTRKNEIVIVPGKTYRIKAGSKAFTLTWNGDRSQIPPCCHP